MEIIGQAFRALLFTNRRTWRDWQTVFTFFRTPIRSLYGRWKAHKKIQLQNDWFLWDPYILPVTDLSIPPTSEVNSYLGMQCMWRVRAISKGTKITVLQLRHCNTNNSGGRCFRYSTHPTRVWRSPSEAPPNTRTVQPPSKKLISVGFSSA